MTKTPPNIFTLIMMISFASVNAVLFTPALPQIAQYFKLSTSGAQITMTVFLVGYALGQLLYGPLANRFGRKPALFMGITVQIVAAIFCGLSSSLNSFPLLVWSRLFLALGSCVGLKMTFTLVSESFAITEGAQILSYAMLAFAITPSIATALGGYLSERLGFAYCFYFLAAYGIVLAILVMKLTETLKEKDITALKINVIIAKYKKQCSLHLLRYAFIMGCSTAVVYLWAAVSPFLGIEKLHLTEREYGIWNLIPSSGMLVGFLLSGRLVKKFTAVKNIAIGAIITFVGVLIMFSGFLFHELNVWVLFMPMVIVFVGEALIINNSASYATTKSVDKSNASALLSFINMGVATISVLLVNIINSTAIVVMPILYLVLITLIWICK